jgi:mono/diheme cytochrome c family protein/predicted small lipoprotein YifL
VARESTIRRVEFAVRGGARVVLSVAARVGAAFVLAACGGQAPLELPLSSAGAALEAPLRAELEDALERHFGPPSAPRFAPTAALTSRGLEPNAPAPLGLGEELARDLVLDNRTRFFATLQRVERGETPDTAGLPQSLRTALAGGGDQAATIERWQPDFLESARLFATECASCHGTTGAGDGPAAAQLTPPPRNFQLGEFRFHPAGPPHAPTQGDLVGVMRRGVPGAGMPMFTRLGAARMSGLADWVRYLALRGAFERAFVAHVAQHGAAPDAARMAALYDELWERWAILFAPKVAAAPTVTTPSTEPAR